MKPNIWLEDEPDKGEQNSKKMNPCIDRRSNLQGGHFEKNLKC